jgi:cytochrome c-type biogenesis protein CcmF
VAELGQIAIIGALLLAAYSALAGPVGARWRSPELIQSARHGVLAVCALLSTASTTLLIAFLTHDFSVRYVVEHSSRDMPPQLVAAAFYSGQQGSLLYWAWALSIFSAVVVLQNRHRNRELMPFVIAVLMGVETFFALILGFVASPFEVSRTVPADGIGLNPLLYDTGMLYHPPMLLAGYMSWTVPFAFAVAALVTGRLDAEWIRATRRYALVAWLILGMGNLLGSWWAYHVLGWGGYWGWDPVENAAIMPWFLGTAYVHSVMIQERRGMLKLWNLALLLATFCLCIFGTFVVRSGVISSVHSFATSTIGPYYLGFLTITVLGSLGLVIWRVPRLRSDNQLESMLSREASFLLNNLLFLGIAFAVFWGTVFPLISEAVQGSKLTVGPPYFNQTVGPLFLGLVLLMGIGPLMPWRKTSRQYLLRSFVPQVGAGAVVSGLLALLGMREPWALVAVFLCVFTASTMLVEFAQGTTARHVSVGEAYPQALISLIRRNNRRYGGYVVHLGIVTLSLAVVASSFYQQERQVNLKPGEAVEMGGYRLAFQRLRERAEPGVRIVEAPLTLETNDGATETLYPSKNFHKHFERQPSTGVVIRTTPLEDLYIVLAGWEPDGSASFLIFVNPLVVWLWIGGLIVLFGSFITLWPERYARAVPAVQPASGLAVSGAS